MLAWKSKHDLVLFTAEGCLLIPRTNKVQDGLYYITLIKVGSELKHTTGP